ncbi:MAG: Gfo/Idh/MocA family oxidoreductase [Verrucomicrobiae bacterium]|nr:Gfo/Idh/MocA family oxidoreductase [Verrucomicrobiae bacterium]
MKKVRLGFIGCGNISHHHVRIFLSRVPEAEIVALCDPNPAGLQRFQRELFDPLGQRPQAFADYREMLKQVSLDGVVIATPHTQHFQQAMDALSAGCHVLLEKPMVTRVDHARALIAHAEKQQRVLSVAFPGPFSGEFAYCRQLRERGELGDVLFLNAYLAQNWLAITVNTWRQDPAQAGGGQAYDSGAHLFNTMLYLTHLRPVEVFAWCDMRGTPVDINTVATIRFDTGALASVCVGGDGAVSWDSSVLCVGTRGAFRVGVHGGFVEHWNAKGEKVRYPHVPDVPTMQQNFVDCILGRAETPCPPVWGLRQALLMDALYESARTGRVAKVQPE